MKNSLPIILLTLLYCIGAGDNLNAQSEFEPNNTILQNTSSNTFTAPVELSASIDNSSDDRDFFKIEFPYCAQWRLTLINPNGDPVILKMYLYNDQNLGDVIINAGGITFNYNLGIPDPVFLNSGQTVYVQIDQTSGEDLGNYTLSISEVDSNEDWECNNYFSEAGILPVDTVIETKLWGYDINGDPDRDYFRVQVPECGVLNITASNIGGGGSNFQDIQFFIYQPDTLTEIGSAGTTSCDETSITGSFLLNAGEAFIRITDRTGNGCYGGYDLSNTPFTLTLDFDTSDPCECNNDFANACEIPINSVQEIKLWGVNSTLNPAGPQDRDYFKVDVPECGVLNITASNIGGGGSNFQDIQFFIYQPDTITEIGSAGTTSCDETSIAGSFLLNAGEAFIRITDRTGNGCYGGYDLSNTPFTLTLDFDTSDPCECNNSFTNACAIGLESDFEIKLWGINNSLNLEGVEDRDYFTLEIPTCGILYVAANNIGGSGSTSQDVVIRVFQPDTLTEIGSIGTTSCNEANLTFDVLVQAGGAYIKVEDRTGNGCYGGYDLSNTPFDFSTSFSPYAVITSVADPICVNETLSFMASDDLATDWTWNFGVGAIPASSEEQNPTDILFTEAGMQTVVLTSNGCSTDTIFVQVLPETPVPEITADGLTLTSSASTGNQWFLNNEPISGATDQTFLVTENGSYTVCVVGVESCGDECSEEYLVMNVSTQNPALENAITLFPNPTSERVMLRSDIRIDAVRLFDVTGKNVKSFNFGGKTGLLELDVAELKRGLYFCKIITEFRDETHKVLIR